MVVPFKDNACRGTASIRLFNYSPSVVAGWTDIVVVPDAGWAVGSAGGFDKGFGRPKPGEYKCTGCFAFNVESSPKCVCCEMVHI